MSVKPFFLVVTFFLLHKIVSAQMFLSFGSIGAMKGTIVSTSPILLAGSDKCVTAAGGVNALNISANGNGIFEESCSERRPLVGDIELNISMNVYPNPTRGLMQLQITGKFDPLLSCSVIITSIDGKKMMQQIVPMRTLEAGWSLNVAAYASGNYKITIDCAGRLYTSSFIKW